MLHRKYMSYSVDGISWISIPIAPISQGDRTFHIGKIQARDLVKCYVVTPATYEADKLSAEADAFADDAEYYDYIENNRLEANKKEDPFQRKEDKQRVNEIKEFVDNNPSAMFPNTIIVSCEVNSIEIEAIIDSEIEKILSNTKNPLHLIINGKEEMLLLPTRKGVILVIDGQHRIRGLEESEKIKRGENFEVLVSILINYNIADVAEQFYTVNYTQKTVNKSVLLHLYSEFTTDVNEITFLHTLIRVLNERTDSPLHTRIKMLGTTAEATSQDHKKRLSVSQAHIIRYLLPTIKAQKSARRKPVFRYLFLKDHQADIVKFVMEYFKAIEHLLGDDWNDTSTAACKSVGIGAFCELLHYYVIYLFTSPDRLNHDISKITTIEHDAIATDLYGIQSIDYSKDGDYGGVASAGTVGKLRKALLEVAACFGHNSAKQIDDEYKNKGIRFELELPTTPFYQKLLPFLRA